MDIQEALLAEHSKEQTMRIVRYIEKDTSRLNELMDLFFNGGYRLCQRAAWVVAHFGDNNKELMEPYIDQMADNLLKPKIHDAVRRNTLRLFQDLDLPERKLGEIFELCFGYLNDPKEQVAIRVFSMSVLLNIVKKEPDLAEELKMVIQDHMPHGTAGFKSRGKKILKALAKLS